MITFEEIVKKHKKKIKKIIRLRLDSCGNKDHDDIFQEVIIKIWENLKNFENRSELSTWIFTITKNTIIDYYRAADNNIKFINIDDIDPNVYIMDSEPILNFNNLTPRRRLILELSQQGFTSKEIAVQLNIPIGTVSSNLNRIRRNLKNEYDRDNRSH